MAGKPAARLGDPTAHGGSIVGPGIPTVLVGGMPAATMGDQHLCPMCTPATPPIPHVGGPITLGSTGVMIGKKPAARMGDMAVCIGPPSSVIMGCPTVLIGEAGSGSQAASAAAADAAKAQGISKPSSLAPIAVVKPKNADGKLHYIELEFQDSAGKPLSGTAFRIKDWHGTVILSATDHKGQWKSAPYADSGSYELTVLSLRDAKCDKKSVAAKDECTIQATSEGYDDGTPARVFVDLIDADNHRHPFDRAITKVSGGKIEAHWTLDPDKLHAAVQASRDNAPLTHLRFLVAVGFHTYATEEVELVVNDDMKKIEVKFVEVMDQIFHHDSAVPCLDEQCELPVALATAIRYAEVHPDMQLVLFSHTDTSGKISYNYDLSEWRGEAVKSLLTCDVNRWSAMVHKKHKVEDYQQCLKSLSSALGWQCDPGSVDNAIGPKTKSAIEAFQKTCNLRYSLELDEDGIFGAASWKAMHRVLCGVIATYLGGTEDPNSPAYPVWPALNFGFPEGEGVYPCGESFPIEQADKDNYQSATNRRVELSFIPERAYKLKIISDRTKTISPQNCPAFNRNQTVRISDVGFSKHSVTLRDHDDNPIPFAFFLINENGTRQIRGYLNHTGSRTMIIQDSEFNTIEFPNYL